MPRKTFDVKEFKEIINSRLALTTLTQTEKIGYCSILEQVLQETGNYQGFGYIAWENGGHDQWVADGRPDRSKVDPYLGLEYDRFYY